MNSKIITKDIKSINIKQSSCKCNELNSSQDPNKIFNFNLNDKKSKKCQCVLNCIQCNGNCSCGALDCKC